MKKRILILSLALFWAVFNETAPGGSAPASAQTNSPAEKPPMFVLQIGIGKYLDSARLPTLRGSRPDVEKMRELLMSDRYGVSEKNIRTLLDDEATKGRIFAEFENHLIRNASDYFQKTGRRDAVVVFEFSGHGSQVPDVAPFDEADGKDETFVTYDSQDVAGKNFDITDDEIFQLTGQLSKYTDNIVYILDSCHSGSATRGSDDVRRVPARTTVPVSLLKAQTRGENNQKTEKDNAQTDLLPAGDDYIVISAAQSNELAGQKYIFENEQSKMPLVFGNLTYYLLEELRNAKADTSYRELMENVRRKVAGETNNTQIPQIEGDDKQFVFGGLGKREDNFIKIFRVNNKEITAQAGAMQGVDVGTILAVYDKNQKQFDGETGKIGIAKVTSISANESIAVFIGQKTVTKEDKITVVSPDLGTRRLKVLLDGDDAQKLSDADKKTIQILREDFSAKTGAAEPRGVDLAAGKWNDKATRWDVALLKDSFAKVFPDKSAAAPIEKDKNAAKDENSAKEFPSADTQIFYLAGRDFVPLYGFFVEVGEKDAVAKIENAIVHLAHQRMVRAIGNNKSPLHGKITITPFRFDLAAKPCDESGKIITLGKAEAILNSAKTAYKFNQKETFWLEIVNRSKQDLYVTLLDVGSDGSVKILAPQKIVGEKDEGLKLGAGERKTVRGETCRDGVLATSAPAGIETFKIIVTTTPIKREDFEFLEIDAVQRSGVKSLTNLADWTTAEINFEISSTKKKPR